MGQHIQGHIGGSNHTEEERTVDSLYIGWANNSSDYWIFKLDTKQPMLVNRITKIPVSDDFKDRFNKIGQKDGQPDVIHISDGYGNLKFHDFLVNSDNDDSNAWSDESFKHDEVYQKEFDKQLKDEEQFMKILDVVNKGARGCEA